MQKSLGPHAWAVFEPVVGSSASTGVILQNSDTPLSDRPIDICCAQNYIKVNRRRVCETHLCLPSIAHLLASTPDSSKPALIRHLLERYFANMSLREPSLGVQTLSRTRSRSRPSFSSVARPAPSTTSVTLRARTGGAVRHAIKNTIGRIAGHGGSDDPQIQKSMFIKECSLYTSFFLVGWGDATPGALLPAIRQRWGLSFVLVSMLFVGIFVGCLIAASSVSPLLDRFGYGKVISGAAVLGLVFPIVFLTMPPFPVLVVAMVFTGMFTSTLEALVNVWISQRPKANVRLGVAHTLYGIGALSSPLAAIPFLHEGRKGIAFQYFFCVSLGLATVVLTLVTVAFRLSRDELVQGPADPVNPDNAIELQPRAASMVSDVDEKGTPSMTAPKPGATENDGPMASTSQALGNELHPMPAPTNTSKGLYKLKAVVKQPKVQLLALFTGCYVGTEVTIGGWSSTFLIEVRHEETNANALVSGFWAGIAAGRILLIPVTAWLGDELAILLYLFCAIGLQLLVWFVPNIIANAVALALLGIILGPAYPVMIRVASKTIRPRAHLTAAISFISTVSAAGMALLPLLVGLASQQAPQGIKILPPILVGLFALQAILWSVTNRDYFVKRFIKRNSNGQDGEIEDFDRLD